MYSVMVPPRQASSQPAAAPPAAACVRGAACQAAAAAGSQALLPQHRQLLVAVAELALERICFRADPAQLLLQPTQRPAVLLLLGLQGGGREAQGGGVGATRAVCVASQP